MVLSEWILLYHATSHNFAIIQKCHPHNVLLILTRFQILHQLDQNNFKISLDFFWNVLKARFDSTLTVLDVESIFVSLLAQVFLV